MRCRTISTTASRDPNYADSGLSSSARTEVVNAETGLPEAQAVPEKLAEIEACDQRYWS